MTVEQNVQAGKDAVAVVELAGEQPDHFWLCLARLAAAKVVKAEPEDLGPEPEDRILSRAGRAKFPRGKYAGESPLDVPCDYVAWWLDSSRDEFGETLRAYAKTRSFRERYDREGD